jgi:hypothetical protein
MKDWEFFEKIEHISYLNKWWLHFGGAVPNFDYERVCTYFPEQGMPYRIEMPFVHCSFDVMWDVIERVHEAHGKHLGNWAYYGVSLPGKERKSDTRMLLFFEHEKVAALYQLFSN